jgi:recombinational DNA repair ATPase RecF
VSDSNVGGQVGQLADVIFEWANGQDDLPDDAKLLVLAALDGDEALLAALNVVRRPGVGATRISTAEAKVEPAGAFLRAISVRGFRGIGSEAKLVVRPAPGLTIVTGRNGSGKSSFSDALEVALTGDTYRWRNKRAKVWSEHWRNIHDGTRCEVRVALAEEGVGVTTVGVDWADGTALNDRKIWVQRAGMPQEPGISGLGWDRAIELYQPILSYDELGGVLDQGPARLFDKIDAILGIEQATDAERRLGRALKDLQESDTAAKAQVRELKKILAELSDERAAGALEQLRKRIPDLDLVEAIATGTTREPIEELTQLKALAQIVVPSRVDVHAAAQALRDASKAVAEAGFVAVEAAVRRANMLGEALDFHEQHGDGRCPVCGQGVLDATWRTRVEAEVGAGAEEIERYRQAHRRLERARETARSLLTAVPTPVQPGRIELESLAGASAVRQRWSSPPGTDEEFAGHLESRYEELETAFGLLHQEATAAFDRHEDEWAPHASSLASWVGTARKAREAESDVRLVGATHEFMKCAVNRIRAQELARLTGTAREIWAALKQESNVNLGEIELKGTSTRRHVELRADVDGAEAQALGVMSQGELHALALALFLPRATMPGSPFRFVVLDDPIQAMDPAKVDGFVRVLARLAEQRQVLVFSHDDRLTQAVRQMGVVAEILEVTRDTHSSVEVTAYLDPAKRYLQDGFAITRDEVPLDVAARIIPGLCRMAVETAAHEVYLTRRLIAGDRRGDVDAGWQAARKTSSRLALAILGDPEADLTRRLDAKPWRRAAHRVVTSGPHQGHQGDPTGILHDVKRLVDDLRAVTR